MATKKKKKATKLLKSESEDLAGVLGKAFGKDKVALLSNPAFNLSIKGVISTQCPSLDLAIGRGGIPLSRFTVIVGKEASGKTTLCLHLCAEAQRMKGTVVYFDMEHKMDPSYAAKVGVDTDRIVFPRLRTLEEVIKAIKHLLRRKKMRREAGKKDRPILIIIDSINATQSKETLDADEGSRSYPNEARIWSKELPGLIDELSCERVALVAISQVRQKLNIMYGDDEQTGGGNAIRFHASLMLYVKSIGSEKNSKLQKVATQSSAECRKNQIAPPFAKARFLVRFGKGIDFEESLLNAAVTAGCVKKKGTGVHTFEKKPIGKSRDKTILALRKDEELRGRIEESVRATYFLAP